MNENKSDNLQDYYEDEISLTDIFLKFWKKLVLLNQKIMAKQMEREIVF